MIKMKKIFFILSLLLVLASCADDVKGPSSWPDWPTISTPTITNAVLTGINGETTVNAGDSIKFSAKIADEANDLEAYQLLIMMNGSEILNKKGALSGRSQDISIKALLPFTPGFMTGKPEVSILAYNVMENDTTNLTLDDASSISVVRPATPSKLYLVDNNGVVFEMIRQTGTDYGFVTSGDLSNIGDSFKICEKVTGGKPDYSSLVWGNVDGSIAIVKSETDKPITTPKEAGYFLDNISFDMLSFNIDKTLAITIDVDKNKFEDIGGSYLGTTIKLVKGTKIRFLNFGSDVSGMLRPEFFTNISGTTAKFDGPTATYQLKFYKTNGFLYIERDHFAFYPEVMYIVGTGAGLPLKPYKTTLAWDFSYPHQWIFFKKTGDSSFEAILYLDATMGFKFYRGYGWAQEEDTKNGYSVSPSNIVIRNSAGDLVPGSQFKAGLYLIKIDKVKATITFSTYE
jgi:hypothetical protein